MDSNDELIINMIDDSINFIHKLCSYEIGQESIFTATTLDSVKCLQNILLIENIINNNDILEDLFIDLYKETF
jgi:hypothetical protein